jgi:transcriptional regulator with XRE-family HTH domain
VKPDDIKALRKELGCTAKELAAALGVDQATVLAWERAETFPTKQYVDKMGALRAGGPAAIPRKPPRTKAAAGSKISPMKALMDPAVWELFRKIVAHEALRDEVVRLAAAYSDPADD